MKKVVALILALSILLAVGTTALAESPVERSTRLLTDYTWEQVYISYLYLTNSKEVFPNFCYLKEINLSDPYLHVFGDETGKVYLVNVNNIINYREMPYGYGTACPGEISFSADETEMLIAVVTGDLYGVFLYRRQ